MRHLLAATACAFILLAAPCLAQQDRTINVPNADGEMQAAIAKARAGLPLFWENLEHPHARETRFALKVRVRDGGVTEHLWLNTIVRNGNKITGTIADTPEQVSTVKLGQQYEFVADDISDWMFRRDGKIVGNETMRALLKYMRPDEAAQFRAMLEKP